MSIIRLVTIIWWAPIIMKFHHKFGYARTWNDQTASALCNKSNGRCDIKAEKREELESKSSHKSDIWLPAASKKWGEIYWKYIFQTLEAIFPYKGVFVTKVVKANIIAFIKTKILRPVLSVTNPPFQKCQPLLHSAMSKSRHQDLFTKLENPHETRGGAKREWREPTCITRRNFKSALPYLTRTLNGERS